MQDKRTAIAIVDDHTLFRKGLMSLLAESDEVEILFDASNGLELKKNINAENLPEVILMDINMPQMDGYAATKWVTKTYPSVKVLALSMFDEDKPIIEMLKSGAGGYLLKESKTTELVLAIKTIASHGFYMNNLVSGKLIKSLQDPVPAKSEISEISANELKFLQLSCSELTYKEIADKMNLSPHTIDNYREALFHKFEIRSRTGLVLFAIKNDLIKL
ncbi:response regulator transcription factor [Pedobacter sp. MC2016-15]|jgi:DNA-binding NarL/FixJ family response regulator|uniref:response regulator transcription factor n=1 Tax=Pedobacter sp. MC2016-15 TaxID=2994473 RepID=UPI0022483666|nr:response regulator transcription factor [Pedobacter sp. MC2016-15]MCX2477905.1 response regulator transcription factor [Pedobacter sp. MC2016-15]